jgi:undecaprenyl-diphosphatase
MELWQIIVLAAVQGVTEFLPISSDGHLVVISPLLYGSTTPPPGIAALTIVLHLGTLLSIVVFYWQRVMSLIGDDRRVLGMIVIATLPAVILGVPIKMFFEPILESVWLAGLMLPVSGLALLWLSRFPAEGKDYRELSIADAWWIGLFQAFAILPGLSRSGSTIATGVTRGLSRASAATFSFLMAIPAIAGGGVLELIKQTLKPSDVSLPLAHALIGGAVAFVVGLVALWWLNLWLQRGRLHWFAWYCIALGACVLVWQAYAAIG